MCLSFQFNVSTTASIFHTLAQGGSFVIKSTSNGPPQIENSKDGEETDDQVDAQSVCQPNDEEVVLRGTTRKRSKWLRRWRERQVSLTRSSFAFSVSSSAPPHGVINFSTDKVLACEGKSRGGKHVFELTTRRQCLIFSCATIEERDEWVRAINQVMEGAAGADGRNNAHQRTYECVWAHIDRHNADSAEIPVLLKAAGF